MWVAYLNMEVQYEGAEEAMKLFQRALPYNDPKKLHFSMLDILEDKGEKELIEVTHRSSGRAQ